MSFLLWFVSCVLRSIGAAHRQDRALMRSYRILSYRSIKENLSLGQPSINHTQWWYEYTLHTTNTVTRGVLFLLDDHGYNMLLGVASMWMVFSYTNHKNKNNILSTRGVLGWEIDSCFKMIDTHCQSRGFPFSASFLSPYERETIGSRS